MGIHLQWPTKHITPVLFCAIYKTICTWTFPCTRKNCWQQYKIISYSVFSNIKDEQYHAMHALL